MCKPEKHCGYSGIVPAHTQHVSFEGVTFRPLGMPREELALTHLLSLRATRNRAASKVAEQILLAGAELEDEMRQTIKTGMDI